MGVLQRTSNQTTATDERGSALVGLVVALLRLEIRSSGCQAGNPVRLAPQRVRLFWKWKSRPGRRTILLDLCRLIIKMTRGNPTWGEDRIAHELWLKPGMRESSRTARVHGPAEGPCSDQRSQSWNTLVRNHARTLLACDFVVAITARFQSFYIFVLMGSVPEQRNNGYWGLASQSDKALQSLLRAWICDYAR
jgi:hypothetical protein